MAKAFPLQLLTRTPLDHVAVSDAALNRVTAIDRTWTILHARLGTPIMSGNMPGNLCCPPWIRIA
jgi:hypothetical protein